MFRDEDDIAAFAPVPAIRAPELDELLAPKCDHTVAAVAGAQIDLGLVEEFHGVLPNRTRAGDAPALVHALKIAGSVLLGCESRRLRRSVGFHRDVHLALRLVG